MRFIKSAIFILSLFLFVIVAVTPISAKQVIINTDKLNVRDGPGTEHKKIDQLHTGDIYQVIQTGIDWTEIQLEASSGWVKTEYITIKEDININEKTITIQHDNTQLRDGPSTDHDIIYFADKGAVFNIVDVHSDWYKVTSKDTTGFVLKELVTNKAGTISDGLKNKTIVIDAGHGGQDVGAIGVDGTFEKDITYKTAQELKQELSALGAEVILTRVKDEYISLGSRTSLANMPNTDAFISIHYNSAPDSPDVTGIGTYYLKEQNKDLAYFIQQEMIKEADAVDRDITIEDFQVLRENYKPAVLVELGFISNQEKEQLLLTNAYQKKLVSGIINGLERYFAQ
ncbi:MAG TPA: N-acetylmuramoyl-L-alanine amidase [Virgibacillus sp.]|nr:N-acetylmuramoyl-L-alanine amidase [Virgibacillus sp.]